MSTNTPDSPSKPLRRSEPLKLKDWVTMGNLGCGFAAMVLLMSDEFGWACAMLFIAYIFDVGDGIVARLTNQYDTFGGHFDTACDFVTNSITSSLIAYYAFANLAGYPPWLAGLIGAFPICTATIRQARSQDRPASYPCYWLGVPRPASAFFIVALVNAHLFEFGSGIYQQIGHAIAAAAIVAVSLAHLSTQPYINHNKRHWSGFPRFGAYLFLAGSPLSALIGWLAFDTPRLFFDWVLFCLLNYLLLAWSVIPKEDYRRIRTYLDGGELELPSCHVDNHPRSATTPAAGSDANQNLSTQPHAPG